MENTFEPEEALEDSVHTQEETNPEQRYLISNAHSRETFICLAEPGLAPKTYVILQTRYGMDIGQILGPVTGTGHCGACRAGEHEDEELSFDNDREHQQAPQKPARRQSRQERQVAKKQEDPVRIERVATERDLERYQQNCEKETEAYAICKEKIEQHGLDMKLVSAHYLLGEPKVLFFFTADARVDFRELVKDLVAIFRMRIELRQIGVRDESRVVGGLAVCGRDYCCHGITDRLNPVSIKMAKEQNLSLNSMKISGPCGRLLCCLSYEYEFYRDEKKKHPSEGSRLKVGNDVLKITEVNILSRKISLAAQDGRLLTVPFDKVSFNQETDKWEIDRTYVDEVLLG